MNDFYAMVITPHPDDAEFGIAGTVAKWTDEGKKVVYVVCTNGDKGTSDPAMLPQKLTEIRAKEQLAAAKLLGVKEVIFLGYEDQALEDTSEFRKEIVRLIRKYRPNTVASSDPYKRYIWHRDHRITGQVVLDAIFPYARDHLSYPELLQQGYEPHKIQELLMWASEQPNYYVDITDTYDIKIAALRCHHSQVGNLPPEWEQRIRLRYEEMAKDQGCALAEAFHRVEISW
ncbi:PIG-L deacetylase family protein [Chloroflexota bacterium]